jgi:hypothetical protein
MMLTVIITFVLASVLLELMLVRSLPVLRNMVRRYRLVGVILSVGLSWCLGHLFAAAGTVVLIGSIASTVITQPVYEVMARWARIMKRVRHLASTVGSSTSRCRSFVHSSKLLLPPIYRGLIVRKRVSRPPK